jgi:hypothetical protein
MRRKETIMGSITNLLQSPTRKASLSASLKSSKQIIDLYMVSVPGGFCKSLLVTDLIHEVLTAHNQPRATSDMELEDLALDSQ